MRRVLFFQIACKMTSRRCIVAGAVFAKNNCILLSLYKSCFHLFVPCFGNFLFTAVSLFVTSIFFSFSISCSLLSPFYYKFFSLYFLVCLYMLLFSHILFFSQLVFLWFLSKIMFKKFINFLNILVSSLLTLF